jgi:glycosyltransferase involved in cell wall biosynthesis
MIGPRPARGWMSIRNYTEATAAVAGTFGRVESRAASWWAPRPIGALLDLKRKRPPLDLRDAADFDLVHIADLGLGYLADSVRGPKTVVTVHDAMPLFVPGFWGSRRDQIFGRTLLRQPIRGALKADRIITVSESSARDIQRELGVANDQISVVSVPIGETYSPRVGPERNLLAEGIRLPPGPRVMSIGDSANYKNLGLLLRALATPGLAGATLVRVGGKLTSDQLKLARQLGLEGRILELGSISREAVVNLYSACDVVAQPSRYEGFGMPVAEAMACGTPVVCTDQGALPEVAGGAAIVVALDVSAADRNPQVVGAFAAAIASVLEDTALAARLTERGFARARAFRPQAIAPRLAGAYARVLGHPFAEGSFGSPPAMLQVS